MQTFTLLSFLFFTGLVALISWYKTRDEELGHSTGYFLAGRSLSWIVIAGSLMLTNISTEQLVGLNGNAFQNGACVMAWEVVASIAMVAMALFFLPRYLKSGIATVPQFLEERFGPGVRSVISLLFLVALTVSFLPFVLYSGALALNQLFDVTGTLGIQESTALWGMVAALGIVGGCYAIIGGLKAVAVSDTLNGAGLLVGGCLIPILGLRKLGDGSIMEAFRIMTENKPEMLSPIGGPDSAVPFATLFTGMLLVNLYYWCTNQAIVQRTFGAKNLAESQKGVLFAALLKIFGVGLLVLPGIIAYHMFSDTLSVEEKDKAFPMLMNAVLPKWLTGFIGAVMFGAILSSFNSGLNSVSTLFSVDIYKQLIRKNANDRQTILVGKIFGMVLVAVCIGAAPAIGNADEGLFTLMKKLTAFINIPILAVVVMGFASRRAPALSAYAAIPTGIIFYGIFGYFNAEIAVIIPALELKIHWLHVAGINFLVMIAVMTAIRYARPMAQPYEQKDSGLVNLETWKYAVPAGGGIVVLVVLVYLVLAQFGL